MARIPSLIRTGMLIRIYAQMLYAETDGLILEEQIPADHACLKHSGNQRSQRSTCNAHPWHAQLAEDKGIISHNIHKKCSHGHIQWHSYLTHAAQNNGTDERQSQEEISDNGISEINGSQRNNRLFRSVHAHDRIGYCKSGNGKQKRQSQRQPHHNADGPFQGLSRLFRLGLPHSPIPGYHHRGPHAQTHTENMIDIDKLVGQRSGGKLHLSQSSNHDGIQHIHPDGNQTLEGNGQRQCHYLQIKRFVSGKQFLDNLHSIYSVLLKFLPQVVNTKLLM